MHLNDNKSKKTCVLFSFFSFWFLGHFCSPNSCRREEMYNSCNNKAASERVQE